MKKSTIVAFAVSIALCNVAHAQDSKKESIKQQAEELAEQNRKNLSDISNTVLGHKDIEEIIASGEEKDKLLSETEIVKVRTMSELEKIDYYQSLKEAKVEKFIAENVPSEILAAGDNEVAFYIRANFIEKSSNSISTEPKEIWSSDSTPLTPDEVAPIWDVPSTQTVTVSSVVTTPSTPKDPEPTEVKAEEPIGTSEALAALGMTQDELNLYLGQSSEPKQKKSPVDDTSVAIKDIDIERVIIMGQQTYINADLTFMVKKNGQNRTIQRRFNNAKVGFIFDIEGVPFELVEINQNIVAFENLKEKKTHSERVN